jgi:hypothetical protein
LSHACAVCDAEGGEEAMMPKDTPWWMKRWDRMNIALIIAVSAVRALEDGLSLEGMIGRLDP